MRLIESRSTAPLSSDLSGREVEVLKHVAQGESNKEIAQKLGITTRTVEYHLTNIYLKLEVSSRIEAAHWAWKLGLVT